MMRAGCAGGGAGARGRTGAATDEGRDAAGNRLKGLLRANVMNMGVDAACRQDQSFAGNNFGGHANDHARRDAIHHVGISGLADSGNQAVLDADVSFVNAGVVHDQSVGDDAIECVILANTSGLAHAFANYFAAAELAFVAINREILFDLQNKASITKPDLVAGRWPKHLGVVGALHFMRHRSAFLMFEMLRLDAFECRSFSPVENRAVRNVISTPNDASTANCNERECFRFAWFKANSCACRNVEPLSVGLGAVEAKLGIGLDKMIMAADLHWTIPQIGDRDGNGFAPGVQFDFALFDFTGAGLRLVSQAAE